MVEIGPWASFGFRSPSGFIWLQARLGHLARVFGTQSDNFFHASLLELLTLMKLQRLESDF